MSIIRRNQTRMLGAGRQPRLAEVDCQRAARINMGMADDSKSNDPRLENKAAEAKLNLKGMGFPGEPYSIVLTNIFKEPDIHLNAVPPWGLPGLYQVTLVLGKPGARAFPKMKSNSLSSSKEALISLFSRLHFPRLRTR